LLAALVLRLPVAATLSYLIAGIASTALYLNNYTVYPGNAKSAATPIALFKYVAVYFGSSWIPKSIRLGEVAGCLGFVIAVPILFSLPSYIRNRRPLAIQLVLTIMFCLGTGLITAMGRLGYGLAQAFSSRYQIFALLFWCCIGLILLEYVSLTPMLRSRRLLLMQAVLLMVMVFAAIFSPTPIRDARLLGFQLNAASVALMTDVPDEGQLYWTDTRPEYVRSLVPYMRKEKLSFFSGVLPLLLGRRLDGTFDLSAPGECTGEVQSVTVIADAGVQITGWAWDSKRRHAPAAIVATTDGIITGLGVFGGWRPAVRERHPEVTTNYTGFLGYIRSAGSGSVKVYVVLDGKPQSACFLAKVKL